MAITLHDLLSLIPITERICIGKISGNKIVTICEGYADRDFPTDELCDYNAKVICIEMNHDTHSLVILLEEEPK